MIFAVLRLRDPEVVEAFELLSVNSLEARRLAKNIRMLDSYMEHPYLKGRFKLEKPENLYNMSDLAYAIDLFLMGDKKAAYIEVVSVEDGD
jgi:hypothetical protein